jgi:hypothetical protein
MATEIVGGARHPTRQIGLANAGETPETITRAHAGGMMTVEALVETVLGADRRAVRPGENLLEETMKILVANEAITQQTLQTMIAEEIDTAAIDIAMTATAIAIAIEITNDPQEGIEAHDLGLALHADQNPHRMHYNGAAPFLHNPTPLRANWCSQAMHLHPRRSSPISASLVDLQLKVTQFRSKVVKGSS